MKNLNLLIAALLLAAIVSSQTTALLAPPPTDIANAPIAFQTTLNNYFGCKTWQDGSCLTCSAGYYFNAKGVCCQVEPQCRIFNTAAGICESCYNGYTIVNGNCTLSTLTGGDIGCKSWKADSTCLQCSARWYFSATGVCTPVSDLCYQWKVDGTCTQCYVGYILANNNCVTDPNFFRPATDSLCKIWKGLTCLTCADRAFFDSNGICQNVNPNCNSWDSFTGACLTCFVGSNLVNGACAVTIEPKPSDLGCGNWNWNAQTCLSCSKGWIFNANKICVPVSDQCLSNSNTGACISCYRGYQLTNGACIVSSDNFATISDLGCSRWDWNNQVCLTCSFRWAFNSNRKCVPVGDNCQTWNINSGTCTACYQGYDLVNSVCIFSASNTAKPTDIGCGIWNWANNSCVSCSKGWIFSNNRVCTQVSDQCASSNSVGVCLSCFSGYVLNNGACIVSPSNNARPSDIGCGRWDWANQICLSCSKDWVFNSNKICTPVSDQCASFNQVGACLTCFRGYDLSNGACIYSSSNIAKPSDIGCGKWDWSNQVCLACSNNWIFNNRVCVPVSDQCNNFNSNGVCSTCYLGYDLVSGLCQYSSSNTAAPKDPGCANWDWTNQICLACSNNWVFNTNKVCAQVSSNCASFNSAGVCLSCYKGYDLINSACVFSASNTAKPTDLGCSKWDWANQICLKCSNRWAFNANNICVPTNDQCASQNSIGLCLSCYKGYDINNGVCSLSPSNSARPSDLGCSNWDWTNQICLACSSRWTFNSNKQCVPVSDQCRAFGSNGACISCYQGYDLNNGGCIFSVFNTAAPKDPGCARWDWTNQICLSCSQRWAFNSNKVCVQVDANCRSFDSNGVCSACFVGYDLRNGGCVFSVSNTATPSDKGCAKWDWNNQVCLSCSQNWVFNTNKICVPVSDQCKSFNSIGACVSCFNGYDLSNGACVYSPSNLSGPKDVGCARWDWNNQLCLSCSQGYLFNANKVCIAVSNQCSSYSLTGLCTSCFKGYDLVNGNCVFSTSNIARPSDLGCGLWDWNNQVCLSCSRNWVFNANKICVPVSDQCKAFNSAGACTACYSGYDLTSSGSCSFSASNTGRPSDIGCAQWNWASQTCQLCSKNWVFNANRICVPVSDQCASFNSAGACLTCYKGYDLSNGACAISSSNNAKPTDLGCGTWDWANQICLACSQRWVFNSNKQCVPISDQCRTFNSAGVCSACYLGYDLTSNGACTFSVTFNNGPKDLGCGKWDWTNQVCLNCSNNWYFNAAKVCVPVSDLCSTHNQNGACTSCYPGYSLFNGQCQVANSLCKSADRNGACLTCYTGYILYQNQCTQISSLASLYLYYSQCCPEKLLALQTATSTAKGM